MAASSPLVRRTSRALRLPALVASLTLGALAAPASAQVQKPTPAEAQELLRARPDLVTQLRQRIRSSGLTPDQVRARLRAEGYPETLLDGYMAGGAATADSIPGADVYAAVRALGITDSTSVDTLHALDPGPDSLRFDEARAHAGLDTAASRGRLGEAQLRGQRPTPRAPRPAPVDSGHVLFGLSIFRQRTSQFEPALAGPVDAGYRLGPGDQLVLILSGEVELAHSLQVTREGFVVVPQVGQLYVGSLTLGQLEDLLYARLGRVYSGVRRGPGATTRFHVSVAKLRTNQVFVVGDVRVPGNYRVSSAGTALTALYAAGGPSDNGSLRRVEVRRGGRTVGALDVYDYLLRGDASNDLRLESGDVVFVPVRGAQVRIWGEVIRPGTYELKDGECLDDVIRAAGGFTPRATRRRIQIERIVPPAERVAEGRDRVVIDVVAEGAANSSGSALAMRPGDVVRVFPVAERVRNRISVIGSVWSPGPQGHTAGMRLSDAIRQAGGVKPDVYLGQVLITRLEPDSSRVQLRTALRDTAGLPTQDLVLREDDEVQLFAVSEFRPERYVAITGAVRHPGRYSYREGMTMRDLVLRAGGLEESAYLREAEIARLPESRSGGVTATTLRAPLDSTYLFDRGPGGRYAGPPGLPAPAAAAPELELEPYDNVLILRQPDWELQRTVVITGEVRFPGKYALLRKTERLSDLIKRAGGLTDEAYPEGVSFYRQQGKLGRIGIDLPRALTDARHRDNLVLQAGDSLNVPALSSVVNVVGAVNSPVAVAYVPGRDLSFYLHAAGGPSRTADVRRAYVTQPNGKVESVRRRALLPDGVPQPRAGSTVFVPEKDPNEKKDLVGAAGAVAQILASLVALVVVVAR